MDPIDRGLFIDWISETSGAIVIGETEDAFFNLVKQFSERKVTKKYFALIHGNPRTNTGEFNQAIGRHPKVRVKMCVSEKESQQ